MLGPPESRGCAGPQAPPCARTVGAGFLDEQVHADHDPRALNPAPGDAGATLWLPPHTHTHTHKRKRKRFVCWGYHLLASSHLKKKKKKLLEF